MENTKQEPRTSRLINLNFSMMFSLLASIVAAGTVTLHFIGDLRHRHYLKHWGIEENLFPKSTDWVLINGYYGVVDRFISMVVATLSNLQWLAVAAVIIGLYVLVLLTPKSGKSFRPPQWVLRLPDWMHRYIRQMLLTLLFVSSIPLALLLLTALMVIPAAFGETAGKAAALADSSEFQKGCNHSQTSCAELKVKGEIIAKGYVLDSSASHIAIFDVDLQRARVLPIDQIELIWTYRHGQK